MKLPLHVLAVFLMFAIESSAAERRFQSGPGQTSLVELYTSEGCSSCPPAEAWLGRQKENPGLWKQFVPLAFHVDYWDRLGWPDRFASKRWTERQSRYAALWRSESVYTPAVVVNGREERRWSGLQPGQPNDKQIGLLSVATSDGKTFAVEFRPADESAYEVHLALLGSGLVSNVGAGENRGRKLAHEFVVLDLQSADLKPGAGVQRASLTISAATEPGAPPAIAAWITARGQLIPLQATGGWLH